MISSVSTSSLNVSVSQVTAGSGGVSAAGGTCGGSRTGDRADISGPGQMFAGLKQLASQNPTKFKQVAADIAFKLRAAAGSTDSTTGTGTAGNKFLTDLAAKFDTTAQTGDVSGLHPSGGRHHRPHAVTGSRDGGPTGVPNPQDPTAVIGGRDGGPIRTYNQRAQGGGTDLKALFDDISKEVTEALSGTAR